MSVRMDRFKPPGPGDDMATCVCCGIRVHYERMNDCNECPWCAEYFEEEDMSETLASEVIAKAAVSLAEKLKQENERLRELLKAYSKVVKIIAHLSVEERQRVLKAAGIICDETE